MMIFMKCIACGEVDKLPYIRKSIEFVAEDGSTQLREETDKEIDSLNVFYSPPRCSGCGDRSHQVKVDRNDNPPSWYYP